MIDIEYTNESISVKNGWTVWSGVKKGKLGECIGLIFLSPQDEEYMEMSTERKITNSTF